MKHLGGFQKLFPLDFKDDPEDPEMVERKARSMLYEEIREAARELFENQFGVKKKEPKQNVDAQSELAIAQNEQAGDQIIDMSVMNASYQSNNRTKFVNIRDPKFQAFHPK